MSSVWNLLNPLRNGGTNLKLLGAGREFFGTVIKDNTIDKTVTVKVNYQFYVKKYKQYMAKSSKFLVHDEEKFCVSGDKVVIRSCEPLSSRKHYYVRNIVKPFARQDYYEQPSNQLLDAEYSKLYKSFLEKDMERTQIKNKRQEARIKASAKAKAMTKAIFNFKKIEAQQQAKKQQQ